MQDVQLGGLRVRIVGEGNGPVAVLIHGYGAPGDDLVALAQYIDAPVGTRFAFPVAPLELGPALYGESRAWWNIDVDALERAIERGEERDQSATTPDGLPAARDMVLAMLEELAVHLDIGDAPVVLGGFSQGAMLSMDVALRTKRTVAGLIQMSGTLLCEADWGDLAAARAGLRVVQSHGRQDQLLPFRQAKRLRELMTGAGLDVSWVEFDGGHEIPPPVLKAVGELLRAT